MQWNARAVGKIVIAILLIVIAVGAVGFFWWYTQRAPSPPTPPPAPPAEYKTYSKYGFSFQYPKGMTISEQGLLESTATDNSGMALGELKNDKPELILAGWLKSATAPDLEISLESAFDAMAKSEGGLSVKKGELVETTKAGHRMIYQYYTVTAGDEKLYGIYGGWYCDANKKLYQLNLMYSEEDTFPIYQRYLDSFVCH